MSTLILNKPILAKCNDRTKLAKLHPTSGEPQDWLGESLISSYNLISLSFDFFINWNKNTVAREIWVKRIVDYKYNPWPNNDKELLYNAICNIEGENYIKSIKLFSEIYDFSCHYMLFKEATNWSKNNKEVVDVNVTSLESAIGILNVNEIQQRIEAMRGRSVPIGPGGLTYGTSTLECYLSITPYFWPGDVDSVLVDNDSRACCIIEFKKHTKSDSIRLQTLSNYRDRDRLKYQSLGLFRDRLSVKNKIPIIMIFYPTMPHIKEIKIEKIEGPFDDLQVSNSLYLNLPIVSDKSSHKNLIDTLLNMI